MMVTTTTSLAEVEDDGVGASAWMRSIPAGFAFVWFNSGYVHYVKSTDQNFTHSYSLGISSWTEFLVWQQRRALRTQFVDKINCLSSESSLCLSTLPVSGHRDRCQRAGRRHRVSSSVDRGGHSCMASETTTHVFWKRQGKLWRLRCDSRGPILGQSWLALWTHVARSVPRILSPHVS